MAFVKTYDAIVIGAGQGGGPLAHKLADKGWHVALIEREYLGGTCVNYGCTPTKTMIASAQVAHYARRALDFGVRTGEVVVDLGAVVARKDRMVHEWRSGQQEQVEKRPTLDLYRGHARFTGPRTLAVEGEALTSEHVFINTGARPRIPELPGLHEVDYLTNRTVMALQDVPEHLLVLGGNYLGLEFGQMFRRFGSRVTVIEHGVQIAPREDEDVAEALQEALEAEGITIYVGAEAGRVVPAGGGLRLTIAGKGGEKDVSGSHLLVAVGRRPNTDDLGLEAAGIETDEHGYIKVNGRLETSVPGVWALGDAKGGPAFTHISYDDHLVIYDNLIEGKDRTIEGRLVPYALYTDPELGRVGLTERQAREAGYHVRIGKVPMEKVARAVERGETAGLMKVVINADNDRLLGAAMLGAQGGELVQTLMMLMKADAPWTLLQDVIYIHPTLTEGFSALIKSVDSPPSS